MSLFFPTDEDYDLSAPSEEVGRQRGREISDQIEKRNQRIAKRYRPIDSRPSGPTAFLVSVIILAVLLAIAATSAHSETGRIDSDSLRVLQQKQDEKNQAEKDHCYGVIAESMSSLQAGVSDQNDLMYHIENISYQMVFAVRIPFNRPLTPYNVLSDFTSDLDFRRRLLLLVNNYHYLRPENSSFRLPDGRQFTFKEGQWIYAASEAEIRPVSWTEVCCLVMGVDYTEPEPVAVAAETVPAQTTPKRYPGLATVPE